MFARNLLARAFVRCSRRQLNCTSNCTLSCRFNNNNNIDRTLSRAYCSKRDDGGKDENNDDAASKQETKLRPSAAQKYVKFEDRHSQVILDYHEEKYGVEDEDDGNYLYREKAGRNRSLSRSALTRRGVEGVFDVPDLVEALKLENMKDIAVIKVATELRYCDYLVLVTAMSPRHLDASVQFLKKLHKSKRHEGDPFVVVQGDKECKDWKVLDMKSIVLHVFLLETREKYDIETLWCVGPNFDDKIQRPQFDPVIDMMEKHIKYMEELQPNESISNANG